MNPVPSGRTEERHRTPSIIITTDMLRLLIPCAFLAAPGSHLQNHFLSVVGRSSQTFTFSLIASSISAGQIPLCGWSQRNGGVSASAPSLHVVPDVAAIAYDFAIQLRFSVSGYTYPDLLRTLHKQRPTVFLYVCLQYPLTSETFAVVTLLQMVRFYYK